MSFTSIALRCLACGGKLGSHFLWTGDGAYHHACFPSSPKEDELASLRAQVASLQKELAERTGERDRAKVIISKACNHLPNGAFCSPEASLDFMEHIPDEVLLVTSELVGKVSSSESRADTLARRVERLEAALTPSADTKAAYMGEIVLTITYRDDDGRELMRDKDLPWTTIKEVMALIRARAALNQKDGGNG